MSQQITSVTAVEALMSGLIDYAGLFPPSNQGMREAMHAYADYKGSTDAPSLGRFILPLARLGEFEEVGRDLLTRGPGADAWRLAVLVGDSVSAAGEEMLRFNCHHWSGSTDGHAVIETAELKAETAAQIRSQRAQLPAAFIPYFEIPLGDSTVELVSTLASVNARAKVRTGGITPDAFPRSGDLLDFISTCRKFNVPFKATAGLHHPIRGEYRLTYEPTSAAGTMYGFLNVFVAAVLVYRGDPATLALAALEESDQSAFSFSSGALKWRNTLIEVTELRSARESFADSFGSCSFREPVDELRALSIKV